MNNQMSTRAGRPGGHALARRPAAQLCRVTAMCAPALLCGCAVLNPAPFDPTGTAQIVPAYVTYTEAAENLKTLAAQYKTQRDALMQQKLLFDVPLFGLGVASAANGIFHGAQAATLALGLGSAAAGGASLYFAPQTRITLYTTAQQSLLCGAGVAGAMAGEVAAELRTPQGDAYSLNEALTKEIADAGSLLTGSNVSQSKDLLAARDTAAKALTAIQAANATIVTGPGLLDGLAIDVISTTTTKVVGGAQNITAAVASLPKASGAATPIAQTLMTPAKAPLYSAKAPAPANKQTATDATALIAAMTKDAAAAEIVAQRVSAAWSRFAKCDGV